jgi:hypothetical protein
LPLSDGRAQSDSLKDKSTSKDKSTLKDKSKSKGKPDEAKGKPDEAKITVTPTKDFNYIHLLGVAKLHIRQAAKCGVGVKTPKGFPAAPQYHVKGNSLYILSGGGIPDLPGVIPGLPDLPGIPKIELPKIGLPKLPAMGEPVEYTIDVKDLKGIHMAGTGKAEVDGIQGKQLQIWVPGTGSLIASGKVDALQLSLTGVGHFDGKYLLTQTTKVQHAGFGKSLVNVRKKLDVIITGTGTLEYIGSPDVRKSITGVGRVVQVPDE